MDFYFTGEVSVLTWAHPVAAVLDMGEKNGKYRHRVLFSREKVWTVKKMDFTIQFIKMNTRAELKAVKSCPCRIGGDDALNALDANGIHDQDRIPTVKLKTPGKAFLKSESRISVKFKL